MKGRKHRIRTIVLLLFIQVLISTFQVLAVEEQAENTVIIVSSSDDLQHEIDNAADHSTIRLLPGIYRQQILIHKPVLISGYSKENTRFIVTTEKNKPAITITASYTNLENISVINDGPGIYTTGIRTIADHTTINNCIIEKTPVGIALWSSNNVIRNSLFRECTDEGIVIISSSYKEANNNLIEGCIFIDNCDGIELQESCYNIIRNCHFEDNTHDGIDAISSNNDNNLIIKCTIINNEVHGIYFSNSLNNVIQDCVVAENTDGDILFTSFEQSNTVSNVTFSLQSIDEQNDVKSVETMAKDFRGQLIDRVVWIFSSLSTIFSFS